uniref:C1q domain-containing protein n=1 Tax=Monodelphis domestica TaxID=13616 RepID=F6Z385_MONDO
MGEGCPKRRPQPRLPVPSPRGSGQPPGFFLGACLVLRGASERGGPCWRALGSGMAAAVPGRGWLRLLLLGLLAAGSCLGSAEPERAGSGRGLEKQPQPNDLPTGPGASSNDLEAPVTEKPRSIDPRDAWMLFVRQSNKGVNGKKRNTGKSKKYKLGLPGPPGPPGPQGPPGPLILPEELLKEFQLLLKGAVRHRQRLGPEACEDCGGGEAEAEDEERLAVAEEDGVLALVTGPLAESRRPHRVEAAFRGRVRKSVSVERRSLRELQFYYVPEKDGPFQRGPGLNLTSGQYTAPVTGFYTLAATLYIGKSRQPRWQNGEREDPQGEKAGSLEAIAGLEGGGDLFTVSVSGSLYLQAGQYASVFVDNATGSSLTIRSGSDFSAVFLGV